MATNLLLEGDDLEALLIKAHSEGGPNARIVRADKYRHGGLWGFFARERFEVAVEIPEATLAGTEGSAFFLPGHGPVASPAVSLAAAQVAGSAAGQVAGPAAGQVAGPAEIAPAMPSDRRAGRHAAGDGAGAAGPGTVPGSAVDPVVSRPRTPAERLADRLSDQLDGERAVPRAVPTPAPAVLAAEGLLGLAERVNAAGRAAADDAVRARYGVRTPEPSTHIDLPAADSEPLFGELVAAGRPAVSGTGARAVLAAPSTATATATATAPIPATGTSTAARPAVQAPVATTGTEDPGPALGGVPHEPGVEPVRPSTSRPEFTALLDTLRAGARPSRSGRPAHPGGPEHPGDPAQPGDVIPDEPAPAPPAGPKATDATEPRAAARVATQPPAGTPAQTPGQTPEQAETPRQAEKPAGSRTPGNVQFDVPPPLERESDPRGPAGPPHRPAEEPRVDHVTATADPVTRIPVQAAPAQPGQSPAADDEAPGIVPQSDPRTVADRTTLRALGVPAAWTRRLRSGDRFAEVLRMLERMPEEDIDPGTTMVAVVGPPDVVRLEAHRTAIDLAIDGEPRPVVVVPCAVGTDRATAIARALRIGPVVLAVETDGDEPALILDTLTTVQAGAVIAVVDATVPLGRTQAWLDSLGRVDALVLDGATEVSDPAAVLQLGLPVVRLDGIPVDRVTWTALLCAQLMAAEHSAAGTP